MNEAVEAHVCWLLVGAQALYGDRALRQIVEQADEVVAMLNDASEIPARIIVQPVLTRSEQIRETCLRANADERCIGVIAWMHTFSPAKAWIAGLEELRKPLLHFHTQLHLSLPWRQIDMDFMNLNQSAHGDREFGYMTERIGLRRKIVVGHASDPSARARIGSWVRAAVGWNVAQHLRVARFGDNMRDVAVTEGDKVAAQMRFGFATEAFGVADLVACVQATNAREVDQLVRSYQDQYEVAPVLRPDGARHSSLRDAAQIEAGLRSFLRDGHFRAFTTNFEDLGALTQLPGISVQRLMADGYGFGAEGDWKTAALLAILKAMGEGLDGGTTFMEDYAYHFGPGEPKILGAHMLEVCPSIAGGQPSCDIHPLSIGNREDPVRLVFEARPGPGFVVGILDLGDRFRMVANEIELVEPDEPLQRLPVAHATWKPAPSLATSAECWIRAGGPHHTVLSTALDRESLEDFANIAGVELIWIDRDTTAPAFARELRWNRASYWLARDLAR